MKFFKRNHILRWLMMAVYSFLLYEAMWTLIDWQFRVFDAKASDIAWEFVQCAIFTTAIFAVNQVFSVIRKRKLVGAVHEIICVLAVNIILTLIIDKFTLVEHDGSNFWSIIDIYIISVVSSLLGIINIQRNFHERFVLLEQEQRLNHLRLMQQQLSPHFIFNSLSTLKGLININRQKATDYLLILSDIIRYITENMVKDKVPLAYAMSYIKIYETMLNYRFPGHFRFCVKEGKASEQDYIIPVSLQIALENAIKHNAHSAKNPLEVTITIEPEAVAITNEKRPIPYSQGFGIGLDNLNKRYKMLIGKSLCISENNKTFTVRIPIIR